MVVPQVRALAEPLYGVRTHYVEAGDGDPLILVHGGGPGASGASGWGRLIPLLADSFHVLAIDLVGSGHSDKPLVEYSFQTLVDHLTGFVDALGLPRVRLVGNSQGAYVAMKYALDHPARVQQVGTIGTATLASAVGLCDDGRALPLPRFDGSRESLVAFLQTIVNDPARLTEELVEARFAVASLPGHREMLDSMGRRPGRSLVVACEPADVSPGMGLSGPVRAALPHAVRAVEEILDRIREEVQGEEGAHEVVQGD